MPKEIGRLHSYAIGMEATAGTAGAIDAWIPVEEWNVKPVVEYTKDESGFGVIDGVSDAHVIKKSSEFTASGVVRSQSIGWLLLLALGQVAAPSLVETGVYSHSFTRKNDNNHPTATIIHDNTTQEEQTVYNMLDTLAINAEVGNMLKFETTLKGQSMTSVSGNTPSFVTSDEPFIVSKMYVKMAANIAGLAAASRIPVQTVKLNIEKNLEQIFSTLKDAATEAVEFEQQHNKQFMVSGDMELMYQADTYKTLALAGTKQAMELYVEGKTLVGATKYNSLKIQLASIVLEDWDRGTGNDDVVNQTFGFTALYSLTDSKTITADLVNTKATQYS